MTMPDPPGQRLSPVADQRFREELVQQFFEFRREVRFQLRSMDCGLSVFRGEANAYRRTFVSAMKRTRFLLLILVILHIVTIGLLAYPIVVGRECPSPSRPPEMAARLPDGVARQGEY